MIPNLQIINPITYPNWDELIIQTKNYSFFHSAAWAQVLHESYGYTPLYFTLIENGQLRIAIPLMEVKSFLTGKRGVSLPFTDYCEPIVSDNVNIRDIFNQLIEYGKNVTWKYIVTKGWKSLHEDNLTNSFYYIHTLTLDNNEENVFLKFRNSTKRNIKKAIKNGVEVNVDTSIEALQEFYRLNCITRKIHGLPPQPYFFFENIHKFIISADHGFIALAIYNNKCIAGAVYFHLGNRALYKYGASERKYQYLRTNNLVMWEAIKYYCQNGYKTLSLGKTEPHNKGLMQFKTGWGVKEQVTNNYKYYLRKQTVISNPSNVYGSHNKIFSMMPLGLLRLVGTILYRHLG